MDMKQTAVEFLVSEMNKLKMHVDDSEHDKVLDIIEQAKEMEKEQIINAYVYGSAYGIDVKNGLDPVKYFETFKSE
jgi:replicative DNA helicase